ncbi:MAG: hypothetical protein H3C31_06235 [Brumimicrobium sp.]|nr:hypothetical protein [Brumimicrobium sp.]MCO5268397.1 hypothetical protein [Brumimicrobium sp.]
MIVVESGGTKSTWVYRDASGQLTQKATVGLHPQELTDQKKTIFLQFIQENNFQQEEVYFFGAGCESKEAKTKIIQFLNLFQLNVRLVETDIYAACIAHLGNREGVVGIIGTGAVVAYFDGKNVKQITSGWGYILGDEGSGFDLGKRLIQYYLRGELSLTVRKKIEEYFQGHSIIHRVYEPDGRKFVAGLTKIIHEFLHESEVSELISQGFSDFCQTALKPLKTSIQEIHFIGNVAYYFENQLSNALTHHGYRLGSIKCEAAQAVYEFFEINGIHR